MIKENLTKLGFSPSEIKVYLNLYETGASYANRISAETNINRTNVYEALDRLLAKGIISFIVKNKIKWFQANDPKSILSLIKQKEEQLEQLRSQLLNEFKDIKPIQEPKQLEATIFIGKKGLRILFEEILETNKPIALIASEFQFKAIFGPYFELWHKQRIKKRIKQRTIFPIKLKPILKKRDLLEYKFIDDKFTNPTTTIIYGDNCLFIQWSKEPITIKIQNKEIAKSHLNYFNMLWNN